MWRQTLYIETEMFINDALISPVNYLIYITECLIYQCEYSGTLGSSSASFFLSAVFFFIFIFFFEQAASSAAETKWRMWLSQQGQIQWEVYDERQMQAVTHSQEEGRCTAASWIIMAEWERSKVPWDPNIIEDSVGNCCIPQERAETCTQNAALLILHLCVCVCICVYNFI